MRKTRRLAALVAAALGVAGVAPARPAPASRPDPATGYYQTDFPPEEFRARWGAIFERIGPEAVAVAQGAPLTNGFQVPRQSNTFYYLCGIETPGATLLLDGRTRRVTLYLPARNERRERSEGKVLSADDAELVRRLTGVDDVRPLTDMGTSWPAGDAKVAIWAEHAPAEGYAQSRYELKAADTAIAADPWDGRLPRETRFVELLRLRNPAGHDPGPDPRPRRDAGREEPARDRARATRLAARRARGARGDAKHRAGRVGVPARCRRPLRLPPARGAPRRLSLDHRLGDGEHLERPLLPQRLPAARRGPRPHGLRPRLPLLRERRRPHVAGGRDLRALAA